jgi:hypothetical protein
MTMRLFKSQLENWYQMDFCDPQFDFEAKVKLQKERGGGRSERNASEAAVNKGLVSDESALLGSASRLLLHRPPYPHLSIFRERY